MSETEPTREELEALRDMTSFERRGALLISERAVICLALEALDRRAELATMCCELHPWMDWPHDDCPGPGCEHHTSMHLMREQVRLLRQALKERDVLAGDAAHAVLTLTAQVAEQQRHQREQQAFVDGVNAALANPPDTVEYTGMELARYLHGKEMVKPLLDVFASRVDRAQAKVAEQAQEIAAKETMIAATDAEAAKALLLLTDAEAKLREQAQEIERLRREWEDAVERERRLAPSLADTQMMARDAQAKLRAVEALRDNLSITYQATLNIWPKEISERLTAILTPEAQ